MTAELLLRDFDRIAGAPGATTWLRRFVLDLAVSGRLVEQDPSETPVANGEASTPRSKQRARKSVSPLGSPVSASNLPPGWTTRTVGEVAECLDYMRQPINIEERKIRTAGKDSQELFPYYGATQQQGWIDDYLFDEELVLLGEDGVPYLDPFRHKAYLIAGKTWVNNHAHVLRAHLTTGPFLTLALNAFDYRGRVMGATRSKLNQAQMVSIPIPIPPRAEQQRIVAKVRELMTMFQELEVAQEACETTRVALSASVLSGLATATGKDPVDTKAFRQSARFYINNIPRLIMRSENLDGLRQTILDLALKGRLLGTELTTTSEPIRLREVASLQNGYAFKSEWFQRSGVRLLRNVNVGHGSIDWSAEARLSVEMAGAFARFALVLGDVVVSLDRPFITTGTKVAMVQSRDLPSLLLQRVGRFQFDKSRVDPNYLFLWVKSPAFSRQIDPGRSNGVPHISSKEVESAWITLPTVEEQRRTVEKVDELMAVCNELESSLRATESKKSRFLEATLAECLARRRQSFSGAVG